MKYRLKLDLLFDKESDARELQKIARSLMTKAVSINEDKQEEEISYCDLHLCGHDDKKACQKMDREEVRDKKVVTIRG